MSLISALENRLDPHSLEGSITLAIQQEDSAYIIKAYILHLFTSGVA